MNTLSTEEFRLLIRAELICWLSFNFGARHWRDHLIDNGVCCEHLTVRFMLHDSDGNNHRVIENWARENGFRSRYDVKLEPDDPFWNLAKELATKRLETLPPHKGKASDIYGAMPLRYQDTKELLRKWIPDDGGRFQATVKTQRILEGA